MMFAIYALVALAEVLLVAIAWQHAHWSVAAWMTWNITMRFMSGVKTALDEYAKFVRKP